MVAVLVLAWTLAMSGAAHATIYFELDYEADSCDSVMTNGSFVGSPTPWEVEWGDSGYTGTQRPFVRCGVTTPDGTKYQEYRLEDGDSAGKANYLNRGSDMTLVNGAVYYVGYFVRVDRLSTNSNPWYGDPVTGATQDQGDMDSYDKSLDWGKQDSPDGTRWVITLGYPNAVYASDAYHRDSFSIDLWCPAQSGGPNGCDSNQVFDSLSANVSPYNIHNIKRNSFETWHSVYFEMKAGTGTSGYIKLYVDGILTHNYPNIQTGAITTPHVNHFVVNSTPSQPTYNTTLRLMQFDHILFTDSFTDIQAAGLDQDPSVASTTSLFTVIRGPVWSSIEGLATILQVLFIGGYFWERRSIAVNAAVKFWRYAVECPTPKAMFWAYRYKRAVKRWQKHAPLMLPAPLEKGEVPTASTKVTHGT